MADCITSRLAPFSPRIESLESRVLLHAGHDHGDLLGVEPTPVDTATAAAPLASALPLATQKLPDLIVLADPAKGYLHDWVLDTTQLRGRTLLRFTTAAANQGAGAIELRGGRTDANAGTQEVFQRIHETGGGFSDRLAGEFTFHPGHGHIHFDGFASYRLLKRTPAVDGGPEGLGEVVATGGKISFCLLDTARFDASLPGASLIRKYIDCDTFQGISVGWNDVYEKDLPDQWIDVTSVPDGAYWLEVTVDPENQLVESNEDNNVTRIPIDLVGRPTVLTPDRFESNDSFAAARDLGTLGSRRENGLSIHASGNDDFFRFTAASSGPTTVEALFKNGEGDLELAVFDSTQAKVAESTGSLDGERVTFNVQAGKSYVVRVEGYRDATSAAYDLSISGPPPTVTVVATDPEAAEGGDGGAFTISHNGPANVPVTVQYALSGTAINGQDYASLSGTLILSVLHPSVVLPIGPVDDPATEAFETVTLTLLASSGYVVGGEGTASITIRDNDPPVGSTGDDDDQMSEARFAQVGTTSGVHEIADDKDVAMFRFSVAAGKRIGFDVDANDGPFDSFVRVFNAAGKLLASNDNGSAPGETSDGASYLEHRFSKPGTYYVAVSGRGNISYDPQTGAGDTAGATGAFTLSLLDRTRRGTVGRPHGNAGIIAIGLPWARPAMLTTSSGLLGVRETNEPAGDECGCAARGA